MENVDGNIKWIGEEVKNGLGRRYKVDLEESIKWILGIGFISVFGSGYKIKFGSGFKSGFGSGYKVDLGVGIKWIWEGV